MGAEFGFMNTGEGRYSDGGGATQNKPGSRNEILKEM